MQYSGVYHLHWRWTKSPTIIQWQVEIEDSRTVYIEVKSFDLCLRQVGSHKTHKTSRALFYVTRRQNASKTCLDIEK